MKKVFIIAFLLLGFTALAQNPAKFRSGIDVTGQADITGTIILQPQGAPGSPVPGELYFDSVQNITFQWNGTEWKAIGKTELEAVTQAEYDALSVQEKAEFVGYIVEPGTGQGDASDIDLVTTSFNNNLSGTDTDVQIAFNTLDDLIASGGSGGGTTLFSYTETDWLALPQATRDTVNAFIYTENGAAITTAASNVSFTPYLSLASTDVQAAIQELLDESSGGAAIPVEDEGSQITAGATKLNFTGAGVTATNSVDDVTINIPAAGAATYVIANSLSDITTAGANAEIEIRGDMTLTGNFTPPADQTWYFTTGKITTSTFTLTGDNTGLVFNGSKLGIDVGQSGVLAGTWNPSKEIYVTNFGAIADGVDHGSNFIRDKSGTGSFTSGDATLVVSDANFTAANVGQRISVLNAGGDSTFSNSLNTTISSVTNGTTVELATTALNVGSFFSNYSTGLDDLTVSGVYSGSSDITLDVEIDATGTPDTFRWSNDGGATWTSGVSITGSAQLLEQGISITFAATTGHTLGAQPDRWEVYGFAGTATRVFYGTDNYNPIYYALKVRNNKSGDIIFPDGHYMTSSRVKVALDSSPQDGFLIGDGTDNIRVIFDGATLQNFPRDFVALPYAEQETEMFTAYRTRNSEIHNARLVGTIFSDYDRTEFTVGIQVGTGALGFKIYNADISQFAGNGIFCNGDNQFFNYIQGNNEATLQNSDLTIGRITSTGTIDTGQTDYIYSTTVLPISGGDFDDFAEIAKYGKFSITSDGSGGWGGLTYPYFDVAIYDSSSNFITLIEGVQYHQDVIIQDNNWANARVTMKDVVDRQDINIRLRADFNSRNLYIENTNVSYGGQNGVSNLTTDVHWNGGTIFHNGNDKITTQAGYGIDFEDFRRNSQYGRLDNLIFFDNVRGDLALIGSENVRVENCTFKNNTLPGLEGGGAINALFARNVKIRDCEFENKTVTLSREGLLTNSTFRGGGITTTGLGTAIRDIKGTDYYLKVDANNTEGHSKQGVNPTIENVEIRLTKEIPYILSDRNILGQWKNIKIYLNDATNVSNLITGSTLTASLSTNMVLWEDLDAVAAQPYGGGFIDGMLVEGHHLSGGGSETVTYARFPQFPYTNNIKTDTGIELGYRGEGAIDLTWDNLKCNYLHINPLSGDYTTSVPGDPVANPAPVWTFNNAKIINEVGEFDMSDINFRMLKAESYWMDFVFNNLEFRNEVVYAQTLNRSVFLELDNYGATTFNNPTIGNQGSEGSTDGNDIVMSNVWFRASGRTYPVTFINPTLLYDVAITLTSDDEILLTDRFEINDQVGTTYTTLLNDVQDAIIRMDNASANTVTIAPDADVVSVIGEKYSVRQVGAGTTTLAAGSGVTLNGTLGSPGQNSTATVIKVAANEWDIYWN